MSGHKSGYVRVERLSPAHDKPAESFTVQVSNRDRLTFVWKRTRTGASFQSTKGLCEIGFLEDEKFIHLTLEEVCYETWHSIVYLLKSRLVGDVNIVELWVKSWLV